MSSSPQCGHGVPWWMASPSIQKAGQRPRFWKMEASPKRMAASTRVVRFGEGVKVAWDSRRPEVQLPEASLRGTNWTVLPPESWTFWLEVVYAWSSLLVLVLWEGCLLVFDGQE